MPHRIAIATEGPSDEAVLETLCARAGFQVRAAGAMGKPALFKAFDKILRTLEVTFHPTHFLVVADLHPDQQCPAEADRWRKELKKRFPRARLCLCIWELEAWLLADPSAVAGALNQAGFEYMNPDKVGDPRPSVVLDELYHRKRGYKGGADYHKEADGKRLAESLDLERAEKNSPSLAHFLQTIRAEQKRLGV